MADVTVTAANVGLAGADVRLKIVQAAEALTNGQVVYLNTTSNKYNKADADASATAKAAGIVLTGCAQDEYFVMATGGSIDVGGTLVTGTTYVVSTTAAGIAPISDLASGDFVTVLGTASGTAKLNLDISATGIAKA